MPKTKRDSAWEYGTELVVLDGNKKKVACNYCSKVVLNISRLKQHLARIGGNVAGCPHVPSGVCSAMLKRLIGQTSDDGGQSSGRVADVVAQAQVVDVMALAQVEDVMPLAQVADVVALPQVTDVVALPQMTDVVALAQVEDVVALPQVTDVVALPQLRIALKGLIGACSEEAVLAICPDCDMVQCEHFEEALQAVESERADKAILPIDNSLGKNFYENYDLLNIHDKLHIVGEVEVSINPCLLAMAMVKLEDIKCVLSHSQLLAQTKTFLSNLGVKKLDVVDGEPFYQKFIESNIKQHATGVIGSAKAAVKYGLCVVADEIQDDKDNVTRFWILAKDPVIPTNDMSFKTSIIFSLEEGPNELCKALTVFVIRGIKLTKVDQRRPQVNKLPRLIDGSACGTAESFDDTIFYVDFEASMADSRAECALRHLREFATYVRVLGSYPLIKVTRTE